MNYPGLILFVPWKLTRMHELGWRNRVTLKEWMAADLAGFSRRAKLK